jgi:hypothetical protein
MTEGTLTLAAVIAVDKGLVDLRILNSPLHTPPAFQERAATIGALGRAVFGKSLDNRQT